MGNDLRYAFRSLSHQKAFAISATLTLALGLGASTAIFSVVNGVLLRPLPYKDADRIVTLQTAWRGRGLAGGTVSGPDFRDWREQSTVFESMAWFVGGESGLRAGDVAEFAGVFAVTPRFFDVMGVQPVAGRLFGSEEEKANGAHAALVSARFARSHYGDVNSAPGHILRIATESFPIIGVLPDNFDYPIRRTTKADVWLPSSWIGENNNRSAHNYNVIARLRPGVSLEQARQEMNGIAARLEHAYPTDDKDKLVVVQPLRDSLTGNSKPTLHLLMAAVGLLLLLSCANVANMLLARATSRSRELAFRAAIGASRWQITRQLLIESSVLAVLAGALGLLLAINGTDLLLVLAGDNLPRTNDIHVDFSAALFATLCAAISVFLFGLIPAIQASRVDLQQALRQGGQKGVLGGGQQHRVRNALVVAEVALSLVLAVGAGLLYQTMAALATADLGFHPEHLIVMNTSVAAKDDNAVRQATYFYRDLLPQLRAVPGVTGAAAVMGLPTGKRSSSGAYEIAGRAGGTSMSQQPSAGFRVATPMYFAAMGTPLLQGRDFDDRDTYEAQEVAIVNRTLAMREFPRSSALGQRIRCGLDRNVWMTIVGVVGDVRHESPGRPPGAEIYMPYLQHPWVSDELHVVIRTNGDVGAVTAQARRLAAAVNPDVSLSFSTMNSFLADSIAVPHLRSVLMIAFALLAALLAMAGVYAVMAYTVSERVPELGLRVALGAGRGDILRMILANVLRISALGIGVGILLAMAASQLLSSLLYGVKPIDAATYLGAASGMSAIAVLAALVPSMRAARVDPITALRAD